MELFTHEVADQVWLEEEQDLELDHNTPPTELFYEALRRQLARTKYFELLPPQQA